MEEIWKGIKGYEGLYQVSNLGRVKSLQGKEKLLKLQKHKKGYIYLTLCKNGDKKRCSVHRLVLMTFQPVENMEQLEVDHINTIRTDNRLENLRWTTCKENRNNPLTKKHNSEAHKGKTASEETKKKLSEAHKGEKHPFYGKHHTEETRRKMSENHAKPMLGKFGVNHPNSIPICQLDLEGNLINVYGSAGEFGRSGFNTGHIIQCCKGNSKTHGGYKWEYLYKYLLLKNPKITELNLFGKSYNRKEVNN